MQDAHDGSLHDHTATSDSTTEHDHSGTLADVRLASDHLSTEIGRLPHGDVRDRLRAGHDLFLTHFPGQDADGHGIPYPDDSHAHPGDASKATDHIHGMLRLVPAPQATYVAVRSGDWHDPSVWWRASAELPTVPSDGAQVWIPSIASVELCAETARLRWLRIDGCLTLCDDMHLRVVTAVCTPSGCFETAGGTLGIRGRITFLGRGHRDRIYDPLDLSGGYIGHGKTSVYGRLPEGFEERAVPVVVPIAGDTAVVFAQLPRGLAVGNDIAIIGVDHVGGDATEYRTITEISGGICRFVEPLQNSHHGDLLDYEQRKPIDYAGALPVANLTRQLVVASENPVDRAHIMQMHKLDVHWHGTRLEHLGRTDALRPHTRPELDAAGELITGSDANTMGRYVWHLHIVTGVKRTQTPGTFKYNVVLGGPKHGIVNHGGFLIVEHNVCIGQEGSGIFCENGTELGEINRNLVWGVDNGTDGFGETRSFLPRMTPKDLGADGNGIWLNGPLVTTDSNLIGACRFGLQLFVVPLGKDEPAYIPTENLTPEDQEHLARGRTEVFIQEPSARLKNDVIIRCKRALTIFNYRLLSPLGPAKCVVSGYQVHEARTVAASYSYSSDVEFRGCRFTGALSGQWQLCNGTEINSETHNISFYDCSFAKLGGGISTAPHGDCNLVNCYIDAYYPLLIGGSNGVTRIVNITFGPSSRILGKPIYLQKWGPERNIGKYVPSRTLFGEIFLELADEEPVQLIPEQQYPDAILFPADKVYQDTLAPELVDLTVRDAWEQYGLGRPPVTGVQEHPLVQGGGAVPVGTVETLEPLLLDHLSYGERFGWTVPMQDALPPEIADAFVATFPGGWTSGEPTSLPFGWYPVTLRSPTNESRTIVVKRR